MTEHRPLKATATLICIFAVLITVLSGLCTFVFSSDDPSGMPAYLLIGGAGFMPFGLLAFATFRHVKRGPNVASEIIAGLVGVLMMLAPLFLFRMLAGTPALMNILFAIPGLLVLAWSIWSYSVRTRASGKDTHDQ